MPHVSTILTVSVLCANKLLHIKGHISIPQ